MFTLRKTAAALTIAGLLVGALPAVAATTPVSVTLSSQSPSPTSDNPIVVTVTVSAPVTDLDPADIAVNGGSIVNFAGSGASYTFGIVPGDGDPMHANQARDVSVHIDA